MRSAPRRSRTATKTNLPTPHSNLWPPTCVIGEVVWPTASLGYPSEVLPLGWWLAELSFAAIELSSFRSHHRTTLNPRRFDFSQFFRYLVARTIRERASISS